MEIKRGIDAAVETVVQELHSLSRDVKDKKEIAQVGAISANHDFAIGDLLADAMDQVGKDGVITVEDGKTAETTLKSSRACSLTGGTSLLILSPMRQIALNAGTEGATVVQRCKAASGAIGYDANAAAFVDLMENSIIDPTKVTRSALQNAASVAGLLLTTEVLIAELPEKSRAHHMNGHMGDMDF